MAGTPVRLALIGAGSIGSTHAQAATRSPLIRLSAVCDPDANAGAALASAAGARWYPSAIALFDREELDGVIIATPPDTHRELTEYAANRGIHVLCEKPLAPDSHSARAMLAAARKNGIVLSMASKFRFVEDVRTARALVDCGELGDILLLENAFTSCIDMKPRWNSDPSRAGGGVIIDNGTHAADVVRYLLGPVRQVRALELRRYQNLAVEDTATLMLQTGSDTLASSDLSWSVDKALPHFLRVYGSQATLEIGWSQTRLRRKGEREWSTVGTGYSKIDAFNALQENFARAVRGEEAAEVSPADALASVEVIEAAYASLRSDAWVTVGGMRNGAMRIAAAAR